TALRYAERGWAVFPIWWPLLAGGCGCRRPGCANAGKHPIGRLVPNGLMAASTDDDTIRAWWARCPRANVGIRTGAVSGLVVLDLDGEAGVASLRGLVRAHGHLAAAWVRTGSGGWHGYMAHPGDDRLGNSQGVLGAGLDVRGDGGYVVAPPSLHKSRGRYRWATPWPAELPPMAPWLVSLLRPKPVPHGRTDGRQPERHGLDPYLAAALDGEAREVASAPSGQRNGRLNRAAWRLGRLLNGEPVEHLVTEVLLIAARTAGLDDREALATIRSGLAAGTRNPVVGR
ncbi:MAG TPA: bifunctional DNA primase/polymerase, partial [Candidatus Dormibacteraeota bacterium]|nr:bifunctional DNA primase/polymerase [Candidatus Dormibacteraeota bacterium]